MSDTSKDYFCSKCKTAYPATTNKFCVRGGKLQKKFTMQDVEAIFPWMRKDKK